MKVSRRVLARYIAKELQSGSNRKVVVESLAAYLVMNRQVNDLDLIVADIQKNLATFGYVHATVTAAHTLDDTLRQEVIDYVKRIENATAVIVEENIDKAVLGGVIIETPSRRFDASVITKLKRLKNA